MVSASYFFTPFICVLTLLTGCAVQQNVQPLKASNSYFIFENPQHFSIAGNLGATNRISLSQGRYQATYESVDGIFYAGPTHAVRIDKDGLVMVAHGGVYLPKSDAEPAQTWTSNTSMQRFRLGEKIPTFEGDAAMLDSEDIRLQLVIPEPVRAKIHLQGNTES